MSDDEKRMINPEKVIDQWEANGTSCRLVFDERFRTCYAQLLDQGEWRLFSASRFGEEALGARLKAVLDQRVSLAPLPRVPGPDMIQEVGLRLKAEAEVKRLSAEKNALVALLGERVKTEVCEEPYPYRVMVAASCELDKTILPHSGEHLRALWGEVAHTLVHLILRKIEAKDTYRVPVRVPVTLDLLRAEASRFREPSPEGDRPAGEVEGRREGAGPIEEAAQLGGFGVGGEGVDSSANQHEDDGHENSHHREPLS